MLYNVRCFSNLNNKITKILFLFAASFISANEKTIEAQNELMTASDKTIQAQSELINANEKTIEAQNGLMMANDEKIQAQNELINANNGKIFPKESSLVDSKMGDQTKKKSLKVSGDLLYFKAVEDSLSFIFNTTDSLDTKNTGQFGGSFVEPDWEYTTGFRLALSIPTTLVSWELDFGWTSLENNSNKVSKTSNSYSIYTELSQVNLGSSGNSFVNNASGKWHLNLNAFDITLESLIDMNKNLTLRPILGVEGAVVEQKMSVSYTNFIIQSIYATPPQAVLGKNSTWGIGPKVGLGMSVCMPININFLASFSSLFGKGKAKTTYSNMLNQPDISASITANLTRLFYQVQLQISAEKSWKWNNRLFSFSIGWETQSWFRQLRLNYYATVEAPTPGSDLTLQGPFAKILIKF